MCLSVNDTVLSPLCGDGCPNATIDLWVDILYMPVVSVPLCSGVTNMSKNGTEPFLFLCVLL